MKRQIILLVILASVFVVLAFLLIRMLIPVFDQANPCTGAQFANHPKLVAECQHQLTVDPQNPYPAPEPYPAPIMGYPPVPPIPTRTPGLPPPPYCTICVNIGESFCQWQLSDGSTACRIP